MKLNIIKTSKFDEIFYKDGWVCLNACMIIKAELITFEDIGLNQFVKNNQMFTYNSINKHAPLIHTAPHLEALILTTFSDDYFKILGLTYHSSRLKADVTLLYDSNHEKWRAVQTKYFKLFEDLKQNVKYVNDGSRVLVIKDNTLIGLIMFFSLPDELREILEKC